MTKPLNLQMLNGFVGNKGGGLWSREISESNQNKQNCS